MKKRVPKKEKMIIFSLCCLFLYIGDDTAVVRKDTVAHGEGSTVEVHTLSGQDIPNEATLKV
ncbi:hypothetical protein SAMN05192534_101317 [Alteribacillus persepolensis]|uniref:Uncharacterized protein n=1 Tax=Alteribacillus persepolensis TaxID=568899 RepID=A0A1G7YZH7_9BACI|nr:hypothetical protein [Alteribacillus persepolensis]SDH01290.1 hypothetical protein SAMN05192534_101317 [Alteribacillus persepolensis]